MAEEWNDARCGAKLFTHLKLTCERSASHEIYIELQNDERGYKTQTVIYLCPEHFAAYTLGEGEKSSEIALPVVVDVSEWERRMRRIGAEVKRARESTEQEDAIGSLESLRRALDETMRMVEYISRQVDRERGIRDTREYMASMTSALTAGVAEGFRKYAERTGSQSE